MFSGNYLKVSDVLSGNYLKVSMILFKEPIVPLSSSPTWYVSEIWIACQKLVRFHHRTSKTSTGLFHLWFFPQNSNLMKVKMSFSNKIHGSDQNYAISSLEILANVQEYEWSLHSVILFLKREKLNFCWNHQQATSWLNKGNDPKVSIYAAYTFRHNHEINYDRDRYKCQETRAFFVVCRFTLWQLLCLMSAYNKCQCYHGGRNPVVSLSALGSPYHSHNGWCQHIMAANVTRGSPGSCPQKFQGLISQRAYELITQFSSKFMLPLL